MTVFRDRTGKQVQLFEWATLYENDEYRKVARTLCPENIVVSTIWQGMASAPGSMIYETAIIKYGQIIETYRHDTEEEAIEGHAILAEVWGAVVSDAEV